MQTRSWPHDTVKSLPNQDAYTKGTSHVPLEGEHATVTTRARLLSDQHNHSQLQVNSAEPHPPWPLVLTNHTS